MKTLKDFLTTEYKTFKVSFFDGTDIVTINFDFSMQIEENGYEWQYAITEIVNEINCLKIGESMFFIANRGNENEKGIILRIK